MLNYTGHPLYDVGVATITAFAGKGEPKDLSEADLDSVAEYLIDQYTQQPLKSFATVPFAGGAYFTQPAYTGKPIEKEGTRKVLTAYKADIPTLPEQCVFTGKPAAAVQLDEKGVVPVGRATRSNIPLITGATAINFHPYGDVGLPVSGEALLAIHALPLGCAKAGGRLLAIHSDNAQIMLRFARRFLNENRAAIQMAQQLGEKKLAETEPYGYRTLVMKLLDAEESQARSGDYFSITAYYFSNSGQGVGLDIYHFPSTVIAFLGLMQTPKYKATWEQIVYRAWELPAKKEQDDPNFIPRRNYLYEDLFELVTAYDPLENPQRVIRFVQTYFLRRAWQYANQPATDPRQAYSPKTQTELIFWDIIAEFLERILHMEQGKIEAIRQLADRFAGYVYQERDTAFLNKLLWARRYTDLSRTLVMTATKQYKQELAQKRRQAIETGQPAPKEDKDAPFIRFQEYISVFEEGQGLADRQWQLIRDLLVIRMIEWLYDKKVSLEGIAEEDPNQNNTIEPTN